jgi:arsenite methyltransferase
MTDKQVQDQWAKWLLQTRFGGYPEGKKVILESLFRVRDRVLANAPVSEGDVLLDVGAGDGLIAFGALPLVGETGKVIFSDISQDLLDHSRGLTEQLGAPDRVEFLRAPADDLSALSDGSVDIVTTRSVLIYVDRKREAFREFFRILRAGGRLSIFEPINRFPLPAPSNVFMGIDVSPVQRIAEKVGAHYARLQPLESDPMLDFDERDLLAHAEAAGFAEIHLQYEAWIKPREPKRWERVLHSSGNPKIPTLQEAMNQTLTAKEADEFVAYLRPRVEAGAGIEREAVAYLWAIKR